MLKGIEDTINVGEAYGGKFTVYRSPVDNSYYSTVPREYHGEVMVTFYRETRDKNTIGVGTLIRPTLRSAKIMANKFLADPQNWGKRS